MNKQIAENNKLIAEFMGYIDNGCSEDGFLINPITNYDEDISELKYEVSWERLMPVIEKIEILGYVTEISGNRERSFASIGIENTNEYPSRIGYGMEFLKKIDATYYAVIQFINWYNSNK